MVLGTVVTATTAEAKALADCLEIGAEDFNPRFYTSGTAFDASSRKIFNRFVEFRLGTTQIEPTSAASWDVFDDGLV